MAWLVEWPDFRILWAELEKLADLSESQLTIQPVPRIGRVERNLETVPYEIGHGVTMERHTMTIFFAPVASYATRQIKHLRYSLSGQLTSMG